MRRELLPGRRVPGYRRLGALADLSEYLPSPPRLCLKRRSLGRTHVNGDNRQPAIGLWTAPSSWLHRSPPCTQLTASSPRPTSVIFFSTRPRFPQHPSALRAQPQRSRLAAFLYLDGTRIGSTNVVVFTSSVLPASRSTANSIHTADRSVLSSIQNETRAYVASGVSQKCLYTCREWPTARRNARFYGRLWAGVPQRCGS